MTCPTIPPSSGNTSTSSYSLGTSESPTPSYVPYEIISTTESILPIPCPPQPISPPQGQPHAGVNFVQPSPIQQVHHFKQLNMENLTHPSNNAKKKGKNRNNNNPGPGGNQNHPQQNQPAGGNQNQRESEPPRGK
jgi:hypothetical protein